MVTDTGRTVENLEEYFKNRSPQIGCTTQQVCPNCGAILYDSPCFHFFTDCPRCQFHQEPAWKQFKAYEGPIYAIFDPEPTFKYQG